GDGGLPDLFRQGQCPVFNLHNHPVCPADGRIGLIPRIGWLPLLRRPGVLVHPAVGSPIVPTVWAHRGNDNIGRLLLQVKIALPAEHQCTEGGIYRSENIGQVTLSGLEIPLKHFRVYFFIQVGTRVEASEKHNDQCTYLYCFRIHEYISLTFVIKKQHLTRTYKSAYWDTCPDGQYPARR